MDERQYFGALGRPLEEEERGRQAAGAAEDNFVGRGKRTIYRYQSEDYYGERRTMVTDTSKGYSGGETPVEF